MTDTPPPQPTTPPAQRLPHPLLYIPLVAATCLVFYAKYTDPANDKNMRSALALATMMFLILTFLNWLTKTLSNKNPLVTNLVAGLASSTIAIGSLLKILDII